MLNRFESFGMRLNPTLSKNLHPGLSSAEVGLVRSRSERFAPSRSFALRICAARFGPTQICPARGTPREVWRRRVWLTEGGLAADLPLEGPLRKSALYRLARLSIRLGRLRGGCPAEVRPAELA